MSGSQSLMPIEPEAYETIEATMSASARGRWFLAEYARRNRSADTEVLLGALGRIESVVTAGRGADEIGPLRGGLMEMASAISRTRAEIAAISDRDQDQTRLSIASEALDGIVRATEGATSDILGAAEQVQETAWLLRERGVDGEACDALDRHATQIYTACSFQDLTAQRTGRIVQTLRYLEERLFSMIAIWGEVDAAVPPAPGSARSGPARQTPPDDLCQSDVDRYIDMGAPEVIAAANAALRAIEHGAVPLHDDIVFLPAMPEPAEIELPETGETGTAEVETAEVEAAEVEAAGIEAVSASDEPDLFTVAEPSPVTAEASETDDAEPAEEPWPAEPGPSFADIDALSVEEKLALFC